MMFNYKQKSGLNVSSSAAPPVPPQRHSSIRASAPTTPPNIGNTTAPYFGNSNTTSSTNSNNANSTTVGRLVIDLELKYGKQFHNVTEFPKPLPFLNIPKVYPSRTVKATNASSINNNSNTTDNNNTLTVTSSTNKTTFAPVASSTKILQPAYVPMKKNRAPAPPPQAGVAAATVTVIRQSSFLYGSGT